MSQTKLKELKWHSVYLFGLSLKVAVTPLGMLCVYDSNVYARKYFGWKVISENGAEVAGEEHPKDDGLGEGWMVDCKIAAESWYRERLLEALEPVEEGR